VNIYSCWHQGNYGYCCPTKIGKWLFVPELGQADNKIYRNISLGEIVFKHDFEKEMETLREEFQGQFHLEDFLNMLFLPCNKPLTVGGLLFAKY
jgi:hypothetical protein